MARRRYQRGSIRRQNGSVFGRFREDEQKPDGTVERKERFVFLGTEKELPTDKLAYRELEKHVSPINDIGYRPRIASNFKDFAKRWQESVMITHKRSAQSSEKSHIKKHLLPRWGELTMKAIEGDPEAVQAWVSGLKVEPKTQKNIVTTARLMFDSAREWRYVTYNPFSKLRLKPRNLKQEEFALSFEQVCKIIAAASEPYKTMYWIAWETGVRAGELLGLAVEHIDTEGRIIHIRRKIYKGEFDTVKSKKGVRDCRISAPLCEHLAGFTKGKKGLLFVDPAGKAITYDHALKEELQPLLDRLEIFAAPGQDRGFHAFRHGNATMMDQFQVPMKTRMDRLGHEKPQTTLNYTHVVDENEAKFVDQLGAETFKALTEMVQ